jgi:hypothetical protein
METDTTIDDVDEEPASEQQEVITAKEAKYLFNRLYSFFEKKQIDRNYFYHIDDKIDEIKFVQSTLDNYIKQ